MKLTDAWPLCRQLDSAANHAIAYPAGPPGQHEARGGGRPQANGALAARIDGRLAELREQRRR